MHTNRNPNKITSVLLLTLALQISSQVFMPEPALSMKPLPKMIRPEAVNLISLNDPITAAKLLTLWLQTFDAQTGLQLPLESLDYGDLIDWLNLLLLIDPNAQYPMLLASRIYTLIQDEVKIREMLEFIAAQFLINPNKNWQWMAHAIYIAKHTLRDLSLARDYAYLLRVHVEPSYLPYWAQQMEIYVLEDMGKIEAAKLLIMTMIDSGLLDKKELQFLKRRLDSITRAH